MANQIILKNSAVTGKVPIVADLAYGELALNYADGKLYYKDTNATIKTILGGVVVATNTTAATTTVAVASIPLTSCGSVELTIQATQGSTRHVTKLLIVHDGTTIYTTEYGTIQTGAKLFTADADILSGNLRLLVTPASSTSTLFKVLYTTI